MLYLKIIKPSEGNISQKSNTGEILVFVTLSCWRQKERGTIDEGKAELGTAVTEVL